MGLVLASENQQWWNDLNSQYVRLEGSTLSSQQVTAGTSASVDSINNFLKAMQGLKTNSFAKNIDWSEFDKELLKNKGDLIQLITKTRIETTLQSISEVCAHNSVCSTNSTQITCCVAHNGTQSTCQDYAKSQFGTEPSGFSKASGNTKNCTNTANTKAK